MRYTYTLKMDNLECQCENAKAVAEAINGRAGCAVATVHTVTSLFSRPHKANKRLFGPGKIEVGRERHLTKAEREWAKVARVRAENAALRAELARLAAQGVEVRLP